MKLILLCALLGFFSPQLIAAERISVEAKVIGAKWYSQIPRDIDRLANAKNVRIATLPSRSTRAGHTTQLHRKYPGGEFVTFGLHSSHKDTTLTGPTVCITPAVHGDHIDYHAHVTVREFTGFTGTPGVRPASAFTASELSTSGTSKNGESVWIRLPKSHDGSQMLLWLRLTHERNA